MRRFLEDGTALVSKLRQEGLVDGATEARAAELMRSEGQPWYVGLMTAFGAWLASLLLIGFLAVSFLRSEYEMMVVGFALLFVAVLLRRFMKGDFGIQMALAFSLTGQGLITAGVWESFDAFVPTVLGFLVMQGGLLLLYPDRFHRGLSMFLAVSAATALLYYHEIQQLIHAPVVGLAVVFVFLQLNEAKTYGSGLAGVVVPVTYGLMFSLFGLLLLSTVYLFPELHDMMAFYPSPWISTLGLMGVLVGAMWRLKVDLAVDLSLRTQLTICGFICVLTIATLAAPGLLAALMVLLIGFARANRALVWHAGAFFTVFLSAYFYGMEVTLLTKSMTLMGVGLLLLMCRFWMLAERVDTTEGKQHA